MISNIRNPQWANPEKTAIDVTAAHPEHGDIPYTIGADDELFAEAVRGKFGPIGAYMPPPPPPDEIFIAMIRGERVRRVNAAYGDDEKRTSLYGYLAALSAKGDTLTDEEKADKATLIAAADWEEAMLRATAPLLAQRSVDAISRDSSWPELTPETRDALLFLAKES